MVQFPLFSDAPLQEDFERSLLGRRRSALVAGEVGIGKTTLVDAFSTRLKRCGVRVACGHCVEHRGDGEPFLPILEALSRLCRSSNGQHVVALLARTAPSWLLQMPEWRDRSDSLATHATASPGRMLREMASTVPLLARAEPLVLVVEDLHWADHWTLELVDYLARHPDPARFLLVATFRSEEVWRGRHPLRSIKQRLAAQEQCHEIEMGSLDEADVSAYLDARFIKHGFTPDLARAIHAQTGGNPLFMARVVDDLVDHGLMREGSGQWQFTGALTSVQRSIPDSILALTERELEQLDDLELSVLEATSVAGKQFWAQAIAVAIQQDALRVEDICMRWSQQKRFIRTECVTNGVSDAVGLRCTFLQDIYQQVLSDRIGPTRQADLERRLDGWRECKELKT